MFLAKIILILSLIGIFFMIARKMPILIKLPARPETALGADSPWKKLLHFKNIRLADYFLNFASWLEKGLRRIRVWFLKLDNLFIFLIKKVKEYSQVWKIRSRVWVEQRRAKKIDKMKVLEKIDELELLDMVKEGQKEVLAPMNSFKERERDIIKSISQNPRDVGNYKKLAKLYLEQKNYRDAREAFKQVLRLDAKDKEAQEKLAELSKK